MLNFLLHQR